MDKPVASSVPPKSAVPPEWNQMNSLKTVTVKKEESCSQNKLEEPPVGQPDANQFVITPKICSQLRYFINKAQWNACNRTFKLWIAETPMLSAFRWINEVNQRRENYIKSPFCDLEQDFLTVLVRDRQKRDIAEFKAKGLVVIDHNCDFGAEKGSPLTHIVMIQYDSLEYPRMLSLETKEAPSTNATRIMDEDWCRDHYDLIPLPSEPKDS